MAKGGFKVTNNKKTHYCHRVEVDYDEQEFTLNDGKPQRMDKNDFKIEIDKE